MRIRTIALAGPAALLASAGLLVAPAAAYASSGGCSVYQYVGTCLEINGSGLHVNWMRASTDNKASYAIELSTCITAPNGQNLVCTPYQNVKAGHSTSFANAPGNRNYASGSYCAHSWAALTGGVQSLGSHCLTIR
jgi:hypothetical protein